MRTLLKLSVSRVALCSADLLSKNQVVAQFTFRCTPLPL